MFYMLIPLIILVEFVCIALCFFFCQGHFEEPLVTETIDVAKESESETLSFTMDFKPKSSGTYAICLDNRSSRFLPKIVQVIFFAVYY